MLFRKNRVAQLLKQTRSTNPEQCESAWEELLDLENLSVEEARTALEAARESYTVPEGVFIRPYEDPQELLIHIASKKPDPSFVSIVARDFERYSPSPRCRMQTTGDD
ncbi:MAG: hypothetical protein RMK45_06195 [Armatimonadota bacterium]|nr:hypothetical protein [Armatimonadota bacterium]